MPITDKVEAILGAVKYAGNYDPYGMLIESRGDGSALGFAGEYSDATGLIYLRARYMDPETGTFLSRDPVWGVAGGGSIRFNPYIYAGANPTNYLDPSGRFGLFAGAAFGASVGFGFELFNQLVIQGKDPKCLDWNALGKSAFLGALSGFMGAGFGLMGTSPIVSALTSFIVDFTFGTLADVSGGMSLQEASVNNLFSAGVGAGIGYVADVLASSSVKSAMSYADDVVDSIDDDIARSADDVVDAIDDDIARNADGWYGGGTRGKTSGREFDASMAGGEIRNLEYRSARITHEGVDAVERHTSRFINPEYPEFNAPNEAMIDRLRRIADGGLAPEDVDYRYYTHELRESVRYRRLGWETGQPSDPDAAYDLWNNTHTATLEDYRLKEGNGVLYHPDANNAGH